MVTGQKDEGAGVGKLNARKWLGALLYLARAVRPDLSFSVGMLSRHVCGWTTQHDDMLARIMGYLKLTHGVHLEWSGEAHGENKIQDTEYELQLYVDAGFAGEYPEGPSTSGWFMVLTDGGAARYTALDWGSVRQRKTATGTPQAELLGIADGVFKCGHYVSDLLNELGVKHKLVVLSDSSTALTAIAKPLQSALRAMHKTHGVSLMSLHEQTTCGLFSLRKVATTKNLSDLMTKALPGPQHWALAQQIGLRQ